MPDLPSIDPDTLDLLIEEGDRAWDLSRPGCGDSRHHLFVPCDPTLAYEALRELRSRATTFLEFGSGAGIVTIIADLLGFEAYGIEIEPALVRRSVELAERIGSRATFAEGTFVTPEYQESIELLSGDLHTPTSGACAFEELDLQLTDFDLVYAFPWPGEEDWIHEMMRRHGRPDVILLTYGVTEGFQVTQPGLSGDGHDDPEDEGFE